MTETAPQSALQRKAGSRPGGAQALRGMTPEKALQKALVKAAEVYRYLGLQVTKTVSVREDLEDMLGRLPEVALFVLVDGPGEARGLMCLSPSFVDALIEVQTIRRVDPVTRPPRTTTRIDAALTRDFVDSLMAEFSARMAEVAEARWARGFSYGTYLAEPKPLPLMLGEGDYRLVHAEVGLADGQKPAEVWLALPAIAAVSKLSAQSPDGPEARRHKPDPVWAARMKATVEGAPVRMDAVLARVALPYRKIIGLKVGDIVPVPRASISEIRLESVEGTRGLNGRLGQQNGMRAVRLNLSGVPQAPPPAPPVIDAQVSPTPEAGPAPMVGGLPPLGEAAPDSAMPDLPDLPALPEMALATAGDPDGSGGPSDLANELPPLPPLEGLGDLSSPTPEADGASALPNLPPLPPLPDLPEVSADGEGLPELPPLPPLPSLE